MVRRLEAPRSILLLVPAGELVDTVCNELVEAGVNCNDMIVDCGNSNYKDGITRKLKYQNKFEFATMGISGGAEGARHGPASWPMALAGFRRLPGRAAAAGERR